MKLKSCCLIPTTVKKKILILMWQDKYENSMKWVIFPTRKMRPELSPGISQGPSASHVGKQASFPGYSCGQSCRLLSPHSDLWAHLCSVPCGEETGKIRGLDKKNQMFTYAFSHSHIKSLQVRAPFCHIFLTCWQIITTYRLLKQ